MLFRRASRHGRSSLSWPPSSGADRGYAVGPRHPSTTVAIASRRSANRLSDTNILRPVTAQTHCSQADVRLGKCILIVSKAWLVALAGAVLTKSTAGPAFGDP
jgi:hypothetical protein